MSHKRRIERKHLRSIQGENKPGYRPPDAVKHFANEVDAAMRFAQRNGLGPEVFVRVLLEKVATLAISDGVASRDRFSEVCAQIYDQVARFMGAAPPAVAAVPAPRVDGLEPLARVLPEELKIELWGAINEYVASCGGDPGGFVQGNIKRQHAVVRVETAVAKGLEG